MPVFLGQQLPAVGLLEAEGIRQVQLAGARRAVEKGFDHLAISRLPKDVGIEIEVIATID